MIWIVFAGLTIVAVLAVLAPLATKDAPADPLASDKKFYAEQVAEIGRERADGRLGAEEAEAARLEAARRLLSAQARAEGGAARVDSARGGVRPGATRVVVALSTVILVPALALALYYKLGSAETPDMPLAQRIASAPKNDLSLAVSKIEAHLAEHPEDGRGFEVVAPYYMRSGRYADAVRAYSEALRLLEPTADRHNALGEALVVAASGAVTPEARRVFEAALALDARDPMARFYIALAAAQDGDTAKAREIWSALLAEAPPQAGYRALIQSQIAKLDGAAPASPQGQAIAAMPTGDQQQMIRSMVARLADRLAKNGGDAEGWRKLLRAYSVLAENEKAKAALAAARAALKDKPEEAMRVEALAEELGLEKGPAK